MTLARFCPPPAVSRRRARLAAFAVLAVLAALPLAAQERLTFIGVALDQPTRDADRKLQDYLYRTAGVSFAPEDLEYARVIDRLRNWRPEEGPFLARTTPFVYVAAEMLGANVARDCQVSRTTVDGYLGVLEDLLLAMRLPVFTRRARRQLVARPKLYWFDAGVFASVRPTGPLDRSQEIGGAALEGFVAQHLRAWIDYSGGEHQLAYWRTRGGSEVNFVAAGRPDSGPSRSSTR